MQEDLLTQKEIEAVLAEAKKPDWLNPNLMGVSEKKTSIFKISTATGLILINGNKDTGFMHIEHRHRFGRQVWEENEEKLNTASEIRYGVMSIDYIRLAESVYKPENLQKQTPEFDIYEGVHLYQNGDPADFRLLTYSNTGIVHTLYPLKSDNKRKKLLKYKRCHIKWKHQVRSGLHTYTIPYKDKSGSVIFRIIIEGKESHSIVRYYIQIIEGTSGTSQPVFAKELKLSSPPEHGLLRAIILNDGDQSEYEQLALKWLSKK